MSETLKQQNIEHEEFEPITVGLVSLGCPKNLVESETLLGELAQAGLAVTNDYAWADVLIVNTCGFLQSAQAEAAEIIDQLCRFKAPAGRCRCLLIMGCWAQISGKEILARWKKIDAVVGVNDRADIVPIIIKALSEKPRRFIHTSQKWLDMVSESDRLRLTPQHWCYLRISEGCSQRCSFCKIPSIRGGYRSKPMATILNEAKTMIADGAKEIILIGQETTNYGNDLGIKNGLSQLLKRLNKLDGADWIRLMYTYPANFTDATIDAIAQLDHVVKYVDIPLQHISDNVLSQMGRRIGHDDTLRLMEKLRSRVHGITIRTTLIVGFPGETEQDFEELYNFVKEFKFQAMGAFAYSSEPGTKAAKLKDQLPQKIKLERLDRLMKLQRKIAFADAKNTIGKKFDVYIEPTPAGKKFVTARNAQQAPQVDPVTLIDRDQLSAKLTRPGTKLSVQCTGSRGYDLIAKPVRR
jgi:ribosomal protein S12 methylthiotransferase